MTVDPRLAEPARRSPKALDEAHQALKIGMGTCAEVEDQAEQGFRRIGAG